MIELRSRQEILESLQENARGLTDDLGGLGQSLQQAASPRAWVRNNPTTALIAGAAILGSGVLILYLSRNRILRAVIGGATSAVGSVVAARAGRWVKNRLAERLHAAVTGEQEMPAGAECGGESV